MERFQVVDQIHGLASVQTALEQALKTIFALQTELYKELGRRDASDEHEKDRQSKAKQKAKAVEEAKARGDAATKERKLLVLAGLDALRSVLAGITDSISEGPGPTDEAQTKANGPAEQPDSPQDQTAEQLVAEIDALIQSKQQIIDGIRQKNSNKSEKN